PNPGPTIPARSRFFETDFDTRLRLRLRPLPRNPWLRCRPPRVPGGRSMSISPELAHIAAAVATQALAEPVNGHVAEVAIFPTPVAPEPEPEVKAKRNRPRWLASASVGVVAVMATGALGYTLYATSRQRDATQIHLDATQTTLTAARSDAATRKVTADYVALYIADSGK